MSMKLKLKRCSNLFINESICKKCGGKCCKYYPGTTLPKDFGTSKKEIFDNLVIAFKSQRWAIDWIDKNKNLYFVRPAIKGKEGSTFDHSLNGECTFLSENGCLLSVDKRPSGCLLLEPLEQKTCIPHLSKLEASKQWQKFLDLLFEAAIEAEKIDENIWGE
ncbi:MAG: hypothetical protein PWP02_353 [Thermosipho sp. (in: thermotogales)]|nr:hypothetical protein [Thermosipho sp. (in: thermotogales)]